MKRTVAFLKEPRKFDFREEEIKPLADDEILIKNISMGLCHSDVNAYLGRNTFTPVSGGRYVAQLEVPYPVYVGHEPTGQVIDVGKGVTKFKPGDYVSGITNPALATYIVVKETDRFAVIKGGYDPIEYCIAEPVTCCGHMARMANPKFGDNIAVVGAGFMGLMTMRALEAPFLESMTAVDIDDDRLELARKLGATHTINPLKEDVVEKTLEITGGKGFASIVEITGTVKGLITAAKIGRMLPTTSMTCLPSRIVSGSVYANYEEWTPELGYNLMFHANEITIAHPWGILDYNELLESSIRKIQEGIFPMREMITHKFSFEDCGKGFECLVTKTPGFIKGMIVS